MKQPPRPDKVARAGERARPPMDPRIRQRRIEVRRDAGRRRLRLLLGTVAVLAVGAGSYAATRSPLFDVDQVVVRGAGSTSRAEILSAAGLAARRQMADVRPAAVAGRLEALPWVGRATVERRWPARVEVTIVERAPVAVAADGAGGWAVADVTGRVLASVAQPPAGLVELRGTPPPGPPGTTVDGSTRAVLAVAAALPSEPPASALTVQPGGDLDLTLAEGALVRFGAPVLVEEKLLALRTLAERVGLDDVATVDVRVPAAPSLTRRHPTN